MTIPEIFDELINSAELKIKLKVKNRKDIEDIKRGLSNYKLRNKDQYEDILGSFRLKYTVHTDSFTDNGMSLEIRVEGNDTSRDFEGVELHGN